MLTSLAPEQRQRLARKRQEEEVTVDARLQLAAMLGNQALARALARQPATLEAPAPQQSEPLRPGIPPWIQALYVTAGVLTPDEANALLNHVGLRLGNACLAAIRGRLDARLALCLLQATLACELVVVRHFTGQLLGLTGNLAEQPSGGLLV